MAVSALSLSLVALVVAGAAGATFMLTLSAVEPTGDEGPDGQFGASVFAAVGAAAIVVVVAYVFGGWFIVGAVTKRLGSAEIHGRHLLVTLVGVALAFGVCWSFSAAASNSSSPIAELLPAVGVGVVVAATLIRRLARPEFA